jgi:hypothetical protein
MKAILILVSTCLLGFVNTSCNRFEASHEQIPAGEQQDIKDKTNVEQDTVRLPLDSMIR